MPEMRRTDADPSPFDDDRPAPAWQGDDVPPPWTAVGEGEVVFENPWLRVTRDSATAPTGAAADYVVARFRNLAVGVLPLHDDGTVTLVGQQRFPLKNFVWEMPEGGAPFDEDPLEGVKRELAEEAGLQAHYWREAVRLELSNSVSDERAIGWVAWGLTPAAGQADDTEDIRGARVPFADLIKEIERGAVRDAFTVATAYRALRMAQMGELPAELARNLLAGLSLEPS